MTQPTTGTDTLAAGELVARAEALRPLLVEEQAATEQRTFFSDDMHERFREAGFYRILAPRRFGGLELDVATFYRVMMAISRGCPSTGWELCLSAGHALQLASYFSAEAQEELFGPSGEFIASMSFITQDARARPTEGGHVLSGTWHFASGIPHATHHLGLAAVATRNPAEEPTYRLCAIPADKLVRLDDWGDLIGLKGSGSHSLTVEDVFIPLHHSVEYGFFQDLSDGTPGYVLHGNPMYAGQFMGFAGGELNCIEVGNALAMLDEYEQIIGARTTMTMGVEAPRRYEDRDFQRSYGLAASWIDAAYSVIVQTGELYLRYAEEAVRGGEPFSHERTMRLYGQHMTVQKLTWEAGDLLFRTSSSSGARDGARMQRYWRDLCAFRTNGAHQHDFRAPALAAARFGLPVRFL
jgi:3-hydroxy-9,10-secoandrosta-1,3,5(10)-triene-9,17-dione monooxygenase